jgi:CBS domain-containing protein
MPRQLPVTEVMTSPVLSVTPETTVSEAIGLLDERGVSGAPVIDDDGVLVGLLDDSDLLVSEARLHGPTTVELLGAHIPLPGERSRFKEELQQALGRTVGAVMSDDPPSVSEQAVLEDVATLIHDREVSRVPVVDSAARLVGIVTRGDLVHAMRRGTEG